MEKIGKLTDSTSIDLEVNNEANTDMKMSFSYQGPAINIKIKGEDRNIFDADLLLALPLKEWPRFVVIFFLFSFAFISLTFPAVQMIG